MHNRRLTEPAELSSAPGSHAAAERADFAETFGRKLLEANVLDTGSLDRARRAAATTRERFDHVLTKLGLVPEASLLEALASHFGTKVAGVRDLPPAAVLPETVRLQFIRSRQVLPLAAAEEHLAVAVV